MSSKTKKNRGTERRKEKYANQGFPPFQMYPFMPGYPPPQWIAPNIHTNFHNPWYQALPNQQQYPGQNQPWIPEQSMKISSKNIPEVSPNEYMVNSVRRIYNNDDGSIEIERVKVQRRSGHYDTKLCSLDYPKNVSSSLDSSSVVSDTCNSTNERRPPPRKNKKISIIAKSNSSQTQYGASSLRDIPQNWHPFLPYMNQMYPFPYPYSYIWPSPIPAAYDTHSPDESDSSRSKHEGPLSSPDSSSVHKSKSHEVRKHKSDDLRASSSAATSQATGSRATDIAPSDSVSMRGFKRKTSLEKMFDNERTSITSDQATDSLQSTDREKQDWMRDMQKVTGLTTDDQSDTTGDRYSFITAHSEIPTPPLRSKRQRQITVSKRRKSNSESDASLQGKLRGETSPPFFSSTRVSESDLTGIFKEHEKSADIKKGRGRTSTEPEIKTQKGGTSEELDGRHSRGSTMSFHSTRQSADSHEPVDTDSTDIALPTDTATADESTDHLEAETPVPFHREINYKWVLQEVEESLQSSQNEDVDERERNLSDSWKAEVSLWRAHLVVSLCSGQGLSQSDWNTFQLLVQHPLSIRSKLSLLNARRICSLNSDFGVVFLRNALLHITTYGEMLLKPEVERPTGWKVIIMDGSQLWSPVKGSIEILYVFGYRLRETGNLRYRPKCAPERSVVSRMTLDLLVLAEEFRLYLNGMSQTTLEITQLFAPISSSPVNLQSNDSSDNKAEQDEGAEMWQSDFKHTDDAVESQQQASDLTPPSNELQQSSAEEPEKTLSVSSPTQETETPNGKRSASSESLTPVASRIESKEVLNSDTATKKHHDNPEEHIYEEITEVKSQVEALKINEDNEPPPLPPKSRIIIENLYPTIDLSISSQCDSISGSTASRTKKRRAPMPPSFMSNNEEEVFRKELLSDNKNTSQEMGSDTAEEKKNIEELNPFYEKHVKATGFVGKNPFYDHIEFKASTKVKCNDKINDIIPSTVTEPRSKHTPILQQKQPNLKDVTNNLEIRPQENIANSSDVEDHSEPEVRPQRRKMPSRTNSKDGQNMKNAQDEEISVNGNALTQQDDKSSGSDSQASSVITVKNSDVVKFDTIWQKVEKETPKNVEGEHQCDSQVVVPNSKSEHEREGTHQCDSPLVVPSSKSEHEREEELQCSVPSGSKSENIIENELQGDFQTVIDPSTVENEVEKNIPVISSVIHFICKAENEEEKKQHCDSQAIVASGSKSDEIKLDLKLESEDFDPCEKSGVGNGNELHAVTSIIVAGSKSAEMDEGLNYEKQCIGVTNNDNNEIKNVSPIKTLENELGKEYPLPSPADSSKVKDDNKLKISQPKKADVIIKEIIISYDISLNGLDSPITKKDKSKESSKKKTNCLTAISDLNKKSILDSIEFIDADETFSSSHLPPPNALKVAKERTPFVLNSEINDFLSNPTLNKRQFDSEPNPLLKTEQTSSLSIQQPPTPGTSPPPSPPLFSSSLLPSKSPSFATRTPVDYQENLSTFQSSKLDSELNTHSFPSYLPETPHASPPLSPVEFLHSLSDISSQDYPEDSETNKVTRSDNIREDPTTTGASFGNSVDISSSQVNQSETLTKDYDPITDDLHNDKEDIIFEPVERSATKAASKEALKQKDSKDSFEERYEIPDVLRAEENLKRMMGNRQNVISLNTAFGKSPERPPRHRHHHKVPPLPPKPHKQSSPPALPPKGLSSSISGTPTSAKSQSTRSLENKQHITHSMSPSPLAIPSVSPQLYTAPAINELRQFKSARTTTTQTKPGSATSTLSFRQFRPKTQNETKSAQKFYVPTKSVSMPSSPKASLSRLKPGNKSEKDRKSWPFQLCNCLHPKDYKKDDVKIKYVME